MSYTDLPLLSDLLQEHTCKKPIDGSPCTCGRVLSTPTKPLVCDKQLRHWENWMEIRKRVHDRLGKVLKREPGELVMNSSEELRKVKQEQLAFQYARVPIPDRYRGSPGFFKLPVGLKDECGGNDPAYLAILTKEEKCEVPELKQIGLSRRIVGEKDVNPRVRDSYALWEKSDIVQAKSSELAYELQRVRPHKPDFDDLCIEGASMSKQLHTPPPPQAVITTEETSAIVDDVSTEPVEKPSVVRLYVNDIKLCPDLEMTSSRKAYVLFDYDLSITKTVATEYLTLKNVGTVTLRFYWNRTEKEEYFKDIIRDRSHELYFCFNKNEGIIIPGQVIKFPIWFQTEKPGTYYEQWELYTKPRFIPFNYKLFIVMHASAVIGDLDDKMDDIRKQLDDNIRDRLIKENLYEVTCNIPYNKFRPTVYSYNKKEVFETINSKFDPLHRQPKYLYNKEVVRELQKFYKTVRRPADPKVWNYRLEELKLLAKSKQRKIDNSQWLIQQEIAKRVHEARPQFPTLPCPKIVYPGMLETKQVPQADEKPDALDLSINAQSLPEQLDLIISKLDCPATDKILDKDKFSQVYFILCTFFDKIGEAFEDLEQTLGVVVKSHYPKFPANYVPPLYYKPIRLMNERFYECLQGPSLTTKVGTKTDQPAAELLQAIPLDDSKRRYRTYYNLPDTPPPASAKGKKGKDKKKPDKKGKDKKSSKDDKKGDKKGKGAKAPAKESDEDDGYVVDESFDPYAEITFPTQEEEENPEETHYEETMQSNLDTVMRRRYQYNLYIIMYNYLDKAISNIVDMIELQPKENLPYAVIKEFEEPKCTRRLIDLKSILVEESAEELKAKLLVYAYRKHSKADWKTIEIQRQLKNAKSDSSLWSVLRPDEPKSKLPENKPISYPMDHYDIISPKSLQQTLEAKPENIEESAYEPKLMLEVSTSTLEHGVLDPGWEDFKEVGIQKNYGEEEEPEDLVAYIENVVSQTSIQDLIDIKLDKATQKKSEDHISDEEHFYDSDPDAETEVIELSIDSIDSEQDEEHCACEGLGICNVSAIGGSCVCEAYRDCYFIDEEYVGEGEEYDGEDQSIGLGICNVSAIDESCLCGDKETNPAKISGLDKPNETLIKKEGKCAECL